MPGCAGGKSHEILKNFLPFNSFIAMGGKKFHFIRLEALSKVNLGDTSSADETG